jgi:4'-phosphopantetheinyl transferase
VTGPPGSAFPVSDWPVSDWPVREPGWPGGTIVWHAGLRLDAARRAACLALLDRDETLRADRFLQARDRDRFIASHAALRFLLAGALEAEARTLSFSVSAFGRPSLAGAQAGRLDVNLSHSGEHALVALSPTGRIGVDIEVPRPMPDALRIARAHFHPREVAALEAHGSDGEAAFYACWTAKEAFVKAVGAGLSRPLNRFAVAVPPAPAALLEVDDADGPASAWTMAALAPAPGTVGAVALAIPRAAIALAALSPDWADRIGT